MSRHHEEVNNLKCYSFVLLNIQNYLWKCINPSIERRDLLQIFEFFPENYSTLNSRVLKPHTRLTKTTAGRWTSQLKTGNKVQVDRANNTRPIPSFWRWWEIVPNKMKDGKLLGHEILLQMRLTIGRLWRLLICRNRRMTIDESEILICTRISNCFLWKNSRNYFHD